MPSKSFFFFLLLTLVSTPLFAEQSQSSLTALAASGQSLSCTFTNNDPASPSSGTTYLSGGKMRGEFDVTDPNVGPTTMHMIHDGQWSYIWGGGMGPGQGIKMPASQAAHSPNGQSGPDMDATMEFDCQPWQADAAQFEPPADVAFQDMGAMMNALPQMGASACAACDQAPDAESQAQCRQMMGC